MKRLMTGLAAASLLIGAPLVAAAHDDGGYHRGWSRSDHHPYGHWKKQRYVQQRYYYAPPPVVYYPAPRVVTQPVYVPAPAPVPYGEPRVSIGFRIFF